MTQHDLSARIPKLSHFPAGTYRSTRVMRGHPSQQRKRFVQCGLHPLHITSVKQNGVQPWEAKPEMPCCMARKINCNHRSVAKQIAARTQIQRRIRDTTLCNIRDPMQHIIG